jgi:putative Mg2+ transporter-C (MgtC) family protein
VGAYGFSDVVTGTRLDPTRVAAQVVSGIGFIGGGLIFVRRDAVRGLTTAAGVWVTAAVGMAAAADLPVLAAATAVGYQVVAFGFPAVVRRMPHLVSDAATVQVTYLDGHGVLREALACCTHAGFAVADVTTRVLSAGRDGQPGEVTVRLELQGGADLAGLAADLEALDGVLAVSADRPDTT